MRSRCALLAAACLTCAIATPGAVDQSATQVPPIFRGGVDVVHLDVSVLDKKRLPVRGLTAGDFSILEDGKPQEIIAFDAVTIDPPPPPTAAWMRDVAPDVATNSLEESRLFVIVIDDAMIPENPGTITAAKSIVRDVVARLNPRDLTAVVFTKDNRNAQDFTADKALLLGSLDKFSPGCSIEVCPGFSISTVTNVADYLVAVPHRRKALIWVSPGVPANFASAGPVMLPPGARGGMAGREQGLELVNKTITFLQRAQRANVAVYGTDPRGLNGSGSDLGMDVLLMAASHTGGRAVINSNDFTPGIDQVFRENSSYYLLGFRSTNAAAGTFRRLEVKVNRQDVEVHTRNGYYTPEPLKAKPGKPEPTALAKAIAGILPNPDLPMQVALAAFAVPGESKSAVTIALGVRQPIPAKAATDRVTETTELQTSAFSPEGAPRGTQRHTAKLVLRLGADGEAQYEALSRIDLAPGRYRLRLAAHSDSSARSGSVFADVEVPDFQHLPFSMSGVVLNAMPGRPAAPKDVLATLLPFTPTAEREFLVSDRITACFQLYQDGGQARNSVQIITRILDNRDQTRFSETQTIATDRFVNAARQGPQSRVDGATAMRMGMTVGSGATGNLSLLTAEIQHRLPLDRLGPGPHVITFEATRGTTIVRRSVRFAVK